MKVLILAGGLGTRLSELTNVIPKPMAEIGGIPILHHIMNHYSSYNYNDFVIALGYKGSVIKDYFLNLFHRSADFTIDLSSGAVTIHSPANLHWKVTLVDTGLNTMTGGRIKACSEYLDSTFMLTYGDGLSDVNLYELYSFHKANSASLTLTTVNPNSRYGQLTISDSNMVTHFNEKPMFSDDWVNGGFMVAEPDILHYIANDQISFEQEPLRALTTNKLVAAYKHTGFWHCMDTLRDKQYLEHLWSQNSSPWPKV